MLLLFIDLAVRLDANIEEDEEHVDDDAAIQALMAGAGEAQGQAPSAGRPKSASPKSKGRKKVVLGDNVSGVQIDLPETAGQNLVPDVVLELEESEMANKRGHVLIAIENPNPDLDIKILVRVGGVGVCNCLLYFTVNLCCVLVSSDMTNCCRWKHILPTLLDERILFTVIKRNRHLIGCASSLYRHISSWFPQRSCNRQRNWIWMRR